MDTKYLSGSPLNLVVGSFFSLGTLSRIESVYKDQTAQGTETLKRQFLYNSVNNQIKRIDTQRTIHQAEYQKKQLAHLTWHMDATYASNVEIFPPQIATSFFFTQDASSIWTAVLWRRETGEVIMDNQGVIPESELPLM